MNRTRQITGLLALLVPSLIFGQEFLKNYPTVYDRTGRDLMRNAATGEYLFVGASNNSNPADGDVYVMRTSSDGTFLWDTVYGGSKPDYAYSMTDTDDGNYIVVGFSQSRPGGGGDMDMYLLKLAPNGRKLNEKWIDFSYKNEEARGIIRKGSDYYVIGSTGMPPSTTVKSDMVLLKMDNNLNVSQTYTFGGAENDFGLSIADANDGGLLLGGQTLSEGAGMGDAYVVKVNSSCVKEWSKTFGDQYDEEVVGIATGANNTAMLAIRDSMPGAATDGNIDVVLQKINIADGSSAGYTEKRFGALDKDTPKTIRSVSTGGYIVGAISRSWWPAPQMWPIRVNDDGNELWKYDYGDFQEHDHCHMIKEDTDGSGRFVATGHQRLGGIMKIAFLRISNMGTVGIKEAAKPLAGIRAYPNPTGDGNVSLSFASAGTYEIQVFNIMGVEIEKNVVKLLQPGVESLHLPATGPGIYIVNIKNGEGSFTARMIVE